MTGLRVLGRALVAVAATAGTVLAAAPAAQAVTYADLSCESGGGKYYCLLESDAATPYTVRWTINGYYTPALDDRVFTGQRNCGTPVPNVSAVITDATGSVTANASFPCNYGPWP